MLFILAAALQYTCYLKAANLQLIQQVASLQEYIVPPVYSHIVYFGNASYVCWLCNVFNSPRNCS